MDRLYLMTVFVAVAEEEGFAGAARRLAVSAPSVTRSIAALEEHLGAKLFNRTTRFVRLSEAGLRYLEDARRVITAADEADQAAAGINAEPRGHISVTASVLFGRLHLMPGIVEYMRRYPAMEVSALFVDRVVNLLEEGIDVAIRIGDLPDSSYRAIRVGSVRRVVCASPAYLEQHGRPRSPEDLSTHQIILASGLSSTPEMKFIKAGESFSVRVKPKLILSDNASVIEAAVNSLGITSLFSYQISPQILDKSLEVILSPYEVKPRPVHIVHSEGRYASAKIRTFIELMAETLLANTSLNENTVE